MKRHEYQIIIKEKTPYVFFCLAILLLIGCQASVDNIESAANTVSTNSRDENVGAAVNEIHSPKNNDNGTYWGGGEWGDRPVVSLEHGISEAAHVEVISCGLNDVSIDDAVENHLNLGVSQSKESKIVIRELNEKTEPLWIKSITVNSLAFDVFLIDCNEENS